MVSISPTSSMSLSPVDMLLKVETSLESQEENSITKENTPTMTGLEVPNTSLSRRSSRSSTRNQRGRAGDLMKRERSRFPCVSWSSVASSTKSSSSDADSACTTSSSFNASSSCSTSPLCPSVVPSPMDRSRRSPAPGSCPEMITQSSCTMHTFSVTLPRTILPEMVTVSAKKGDRLDVVADAWHMERDCHYEWQIRFAPGDVDMGTVRAQLGSDGMLSIEVQRCPPGQTCSPRTGIGLRYRF
ncbi:hypothetical protein V8B97DRAFT_1321844 [Scleroderma yunnanense]